VKACWALLLVLPACSGEATLHAGLGAEALGALVVVDGPEGRAVSGVGAAPFSYQGRASGPVTVTVLEYAAPLEALGFREGPLPLARLGGPGLAPPPPDAAARAVLDSGGAFTLAPIPPEAVPLEELRLEVPTLPECMAGGGCLVERPIDGALVCRTPCPTPPEPAPPRAPAAPVLTPCLAGWVAVPPASEDEVTECAPWAAALTCPAGQAQRPGESACVPVGDPCPAAGRFAEVLPEGVRFVDPAAAAGGDGSQAAPYQTLDEALAGAGSATVTVALALGAHPAPSTWPAQVDLRGACAAGTTLTRLTVRGGALSARGLTVGAVSVVGGTLRLRGAVLAADADPALRATGGEVWLSDAAVQRALEARGPARLVAERVAVAGPIRFEAGAQGELRQVSSRGAPFGLAVVEGAEVVVEGLAVVEPTVGGVAVAQGGQLRGAHLWTAPGPEGSAHVVVTEAASRLELQKVRIRGGASAGIDVVGQAVLSDVVASDTRPEEETQLYGAGVQVREGGQLVLTRAAVLRSLGYGIIALNEGTRAELTDVRVADVPGWRADGERGMGLGVADRAEVVLDGVLLTRPHGMGLVADRRARVTGQDLTILDVRPRDANGAYGRGMELSRECSVELTRVLVRQARNIAVHGLDPGTTVRLTDLRVEDTTQSACWEFSCNSGIADGITAVLGADVEVHRFVVEDNGQFGVRVVNETRLALFEGRVTGHPVGAQVINEAFDLGLLMRGVRYEDNAETLSLLTE
jgi:hypothetical protein